MVQALAIDGDGGLFAFALTLEGGRVHVRRAGSPAADLGDPNHPLDAGAPATALLFFSLSGSRVLAAGTTGGKVRLWQLHDNGGTSGDPRDLNFSGAEVQSLAFRPLKAQGVVRLAGLSRLGDITVWTGDASADVGAFPQDGTALKVTAWESNSAGQPLGARASLVWKPDATQLAVASQDGNVFLVPVTDQTSAPPA
jgi:WD40 repeat protein